MTDESFPQNFRSFPGARGNYLFFPGPRKKISNFQEFWGNSRSFGGIPGVLGEFQEFWGNSRSLGGIPGVWGEFQEFGGNSRSFPGILRVFKEFSRNSRSSEHHVKCATSWIRRGLCILICIASLIKYSYALVRLSRNLFWNKHSDNNCFVSNV